MKPHHFHLVAAVLMLIASVVSLFKGQYLLGGFFVLGAVAALIQWKAVKSGLVDL